jgi:hypothetical protein
MVPVFTVVGLVLTAFVLGAIAALAVIYATGPMGPRF